MARTSDDILRRRRFAPIVLCLACLILPGHLGTPLTPVAVRAAEPPATKRILLLHREGLGDPVRAGFDAAFIEVIRSASPVPIDLYVETVETERFPGPEQSRVVKEYLKDKYADRKIDVIVAVTDAALAFARQNSAMFGNPPIVAVASNENEIAGSTGNVTGLQGGRTFGQTVALARALFPETERVFVVWGTRDRIWRSEAAFGRVEHQFRGLGFVYLRDLPLTELVSRVAAVPERSIVLYLRQTMRDQSHDIDPVDALSQVVAAARVPVFSVYERFLGRGIVGGDVWRFEADARRIAEMAKLVASGASPRDIPSGYISTTTTLDWRELQRWNIPASRVPAGSTVIFRPLSFFEQNRGVFLGGALVFVAQLALILGLLAERMWRRRAELDSRNSEQLYRSVVDSQNDLICRFLPDSTLTFVNGAYCRFWNKPREAMLGTRFVELIPMSSRQQVLEHIDRLQGGTQRTSIRSCCATGPSAGITGSIRPFSTKSGKLVEYQGVGRDITDQKRAEEAINKLAARNSAILRAVPDLMFILLRDGTFVDYHARDATLLFVPPDGFVGKKVRDIFPAWIADLFMEAIERACGETEPVVIEYELAMPELKYFEARLVHAEHDRVLSIVRDVTESKRALATNRALAGRLISSQEDERTRIARDLHDGVCQDVAAVSVDISHLRRLNAGIQRADVQEILRAVEHRAAGVAETLRLLSHGLHPSVLQHVGLLAALQAHCAEFERQQRGPRAVLGRRTRRAGQPARLAVAVPHRAGSVAKRGASRARAARDGVARARRQTADDDGVRRRRWIRRRRGAAARGAGPRQHRGAGAAGPGAGDRPLEAGPWHDGRGPCADRRRRSPARTAR